MKWHRHIAQTHSQPNNKQTYDKNKRKKEHECGLCKIKHARKHKWQTHTHKMQKPNKTHRKSSSCLINSVRLSLLHCTSASMGCLLKMSSTSIGTLRSGNSGKLFKASFVTANRDDKLDLKISQDKHKQNYNNKQYRMTLFKEFNCGKTSAQTFIYLNWK